MKNQTVQTLINDVTAADVINASGAMSKRDQNKHVSEELYLDIISFMGVLYKMGFDDCVDNDVLFVEMLNESGFRTLQGHEFTNVSYRNFMKRMSEDAKIAVKNTLKGEYV